MIKINLYCEKNKRFNLSFMKISELLTDSARINAEMSLTALKQEIIQKPIVIFGSGYLGEKVGGLLFSKKNNVVAYSDNNSSKWETSLHGVQIISPKLAAEQFGNNAVFVVCIWSPGHSYVNTKRQLQTLGVEVVIHCEGLFQIYPTELLPHFHFETPDFYFKHKNNIENIYNILDDEESKRQYLAQIDCRINRNFEGLPPVDTKNQYFPSGVFNLTNHESFFDAGAYDGDTINEFCKRTNNRFEHYYALEPDPGNRTKLQKNVDSMGIQNVSMLPYAVGDENCILKFDANGGSGSSISENGALEVECVRIDEKFADTPLTYLKFDIEGFELNALKGAIKTIEKYKPKLAVCLYHKPDDLWTIPEFLIERFPFYEFHVRSHFYDGWEFVLYAIPKPNNN